MASSMPSVPIQQRIHARKRGARSRTSTGRITADPFNSSDHDAYSLNMLWLGVWRKGEIGFFYPEEGRLSGMVRRKEPTVNALSAAAAAAVERARQ
jgi:hypothetical protein